MTPPARSRRSRPRVDDVPSPAVIAAAALTQHATVYALGSFVGLALSLGNVLVLTWFLEPADFGRLGLALVAASLLTITLNAPLLHGALRSSFGSAEDSPETEAPLASSDLRRRSFGSALSATAAAGLAAVLIAGLVAVLALDVEAGAFAALVALSGAAGAIWRLLSAVPRLQRRPGAYVVLAALRPLAVLSISLPLVANGAGVIGAITGVALGTLAADIAALGFARGALRPAWDRADLVLMLRRSRPLLPLIAGTWIVQNVDLYVVAGFATAADAGHYRLASRLGALGSFGTSAFLAAWGPLELSAAFRASDERVGRAPLRSALLYQFLLLCTLLVLVLAVAADQLVRIAPDEYRGAADLVPVLALAFVTQGAVTGLYRAGSFPARAPTFRRGTLYASLVYIPLSMGLVATIGAVGAAIGAAIALGGVGAALVLASRRDGAPFALPARRLGIAIAAAVALYLMTRWIEPGSRALELIVHAAAPLLFVLLMPVLWPADHRRSLRPLLRSVRMRRLEGIRDP